MICFSSSLLKPGLLSTSCPRALNCSAHILSVASLNRILANRACAHATEMSHYYNTSLRDVKQNIECGRVEHLQIFESSRRTYSNRMSAHTSVLPVCARCCDAPLRFPPFPTPAGLSQRETTFFPAVVHQKVKGGRREGGRGEISRLVRRKRVEEMEEEGNLAAVEL